MARAISFALAFALLTACDGGERPALPTGPSPVSTKVEFSIASSASRTASAPACSGEIRLHPSFWGFAQVNMATTEPGTWGILFEDVPIGRHTVRLHAPAACGELELSANGVPLNDRETGVFHFLLHADASVTP